jgi:hypothetical protein
MLGDGHWMEEVEAGPNAWKALEKAQLEPGNGYTKEGLHQGVAPSVGATLLDWSGRGGLQVKVARDVRRLPINIGVCGSFLTRHALINLVEQACMTSVTIASASLVLMTRSKLDDVHQQELHRLLTSYLEDSGGGALRRRAIIECCVHEFHSGGLTTFGGVKAVLLFKNPGSHISGYRRRSGT